MTLAPFRPSTCASVGGSWRAPHRGVRYGRCFCRISTSGFKRARRGSWPCSCGASTPRRIVLAGDIVDHLSLAQRFFWNDEHTQVVRALLAKRRAGARLIYIPGNHDSNLSHGGRAAAAARWKCTASGCIGPRVASGCWWCTATSSMARWRTPARRWLSLARQCALRLHRGRERPPERRAPRARSTVLAARRAAEARHRRQRALHRALRAAGRAACARRTGFDGILCGHIHRANLRHVGQHALLQHRDWVETCSAIVEDRVGRAAAAALVACTNRRDHGAAARGWSRAGVRL